MLLQREGICTNCSALVEARRSIHIGSTAERLRRETSQIQGPRMPHVRCEPEVKQCGGLQQHTAHMSDGLRRNLVRDLTGWQFQQFQLSSYTQTCFDESKHQCWQCCTACTDEAAKVLSVTSASLLGCASVCCSERKALQAINLVLAFALKPAQPSQEQETSRLACCEKIVQMCADRFVEWKSNQSIKLEASWSYVITSHTASSLAPH